MQHCFFLFRQNAKHGFAALAIAVISIITFFSCQPDKKSPGVSAKPNFIIILADDLGWHDVGYHGSEISTPAIDKMAREGVVLDRFYVHSVCSPTRAALLTGRHPSRYGIRTPLGDAPGLPKGTVTIAELLKRHGYETFISGKWHLGTVPEGRPRQYGFSSSYGYLNGQLDPYTHLYVNGNRTWHRNDSLIDEEGHATDLITDEAVRVIKKSSTEEKPFFLYVAYSVPHYPLDEPEKWVRPYENTIANKWRRLYAASVTHMDDGIGKILKAVENQGIEENTFILFFSDNGAQKSWSSKTYYGGKFPPHDVLGDNTPLRDWKTSLYEGALRVPAVIYRKGKLKPSKITEAINVADVYPTLASLAGIPMGENLRLDGISFAHVLEGDRMPDDRIMYWRLNYGFALKKGYWKLIHHGKSLEEGADELYNVTNDPEEKHDMAHEKTAILEELKREMSRQVAKDGF